MDTEKLVCKECSEGFSCTLKWRNYAGHWCHSCRRAYMRKSLSRYRQTGKSKIYAAKYAAENPVKIREFSSSARSRKREWMQALKDKPCSDCGIKYHYSAMEYDHINPENKMGCIAAMQRLTKALILAEIDKCELVCANCHRLRGHNRRVEKNKNVSNLKYSAARGAIGNIQPPCEI